MHGQQNIKRRKKISKNIPATLKFQAL